MSLSGYALDEGQLASPGDLLDRLSRRGAGGAVGQLGGVFSLVHVAAAGTVRAWNTQARLEHVYRATRGGRTGLPIESWPPTTPSLARPELDSVAARAEVDDLLDRLRRDQLGGDRAAGHSAWLLFSVALLLSDQWLHPDRPRT